MEISGLDDAGPESGLKTVAKDTGTSYPLAGAATSAAKLRFNWVVLRFMTSWLLSLMVLFVIVLLSDLEWARPKIQEAMSDSFHRKVELGRLSWVLGLNGLAVSTDKLWLMESTGQPFILSGRSEIGVAFLPLFSKRVMVKHVLFKDTEVFATQISPDKWNFTDLLVEGPEIRFVQVEHGRLHLRNELTVPIPASKTATSVFANTNWRSYDFEDVNLKLIFPEGDQKRPWPFYISFKLPRAVGDKKYTSYLSLTMLNRGVLKGWTSRQSQIELSAQEFNPNDWRPFIRIPSGFNGLFTLDFKGQGKVEEGVAGQISYKASDISFFNEKQEVFHAPEARGKADVAVKNNEVSWTKGAIDVAGVKLDSEGYIVDLDQPKPTYTVLVSAHLENLAQLKDTSFGQLFPGFGTGRKGLSGSAIVAVELKGKGGQEQVFTSLKADNIPLTNLLSGQGEEGAPLLSLFQIRPDAPIKGQISIESTGRILLKDVEIPAKDSTLKIHGFINAKKKEHDVFIEADGLSLDRMDAAELAMLKGKSSKVKHKSLSLSGKVDFQAHFKADKKSVVTLNAKLREAAVHSADSGLLACDLSGNISFDGTIISLNGIKGVLSGRGGTEGSAIEIAGTVQARDNGKLNVQVRGQQVDFPQLLGFASAVDMKSVSKDIESLHGNVRNLEVNVSGKVDQPQINASFIPLDLRYEIKDASSGSVRVLKASGGNVCLAENALDLRNVEMVLGSGKLVVSAAGQIKAQTLVPKVMHVKSRAVDIADVVHLLRSSNVPESMRKQISQAFQGPGLSVTQGKAYGDLTVRFREKSAYALEGIVGLTNVSGKVDSLAATFDHLSGLLAFSGDDVALKDMMVQSAGGRYNFSGQVKALQQSPSWSIELSGKARGKDLKQLLPGPTTADDFDINSQAPLAVLAKFNDDGKILDGKFSLQADPGDQLSFGAAGIIIHQPAGQALSVEGDVSAIDAGNIKTLEIDNLQVSIGNHLVKAAAKWSQERSGKPVMELTASTPSPLPAGIAFGAWLPGIDQAGSGGTVKGTLSASGEAGHLNSKFDFAFNKVTVPALNLREMDGKIESSHWMIGEDSASDKVASEMKVWLPHAVIGGVDTRDLKVSFLLSAGADSKIVWKDGTASVAGGKVLISGYYLPPTTKWHLDLGLEKLEVDQFVAGMIERSGEFSGLADGTIVLNSTANGAAIANLCGNGKLTIYKGSVPRLGQLHEKLSASNLIQQGIFGFNLNNVMRSVLPVKNGEFREVSVNFDIVNGVVDIDRLNFDGNDLRLRAAGTWDLSTDALELDVAGNIPRVASSILPGAVGEATRVLTLQRAVRVMTFRKLENLPSFPILGDIGTDDPRAFTFKVAAASMSPNDVGRSIERSFKWLPNKPNASAHPLPGL